MVSRRQEEFSTDGYSPSLFLLRNSKGKKKTKKTKQSSSRPAQSVPRREESPDPATSQYPSASVMRASLCLSRALPAGWARGGLESGGDGGRIVVSVEAADTAVADGSGGRFLESVRLVCEPRSPSTFFPPPPKSRKNRTEQNRTNLGSCRSIPKPPPPWPSSKRLRYDTVGTRHGGYDTVGTIRQGVGER